MPRSREATLIALVLALSTAWAQTSPYCAAVEVFVRDGEAGTPVADAAVTLDRWTAHTDTEGIATFPCVPGGASMNLSVEAPDRPWVGWGSGSYGNAEGVRVDRYGESTTEMPPPVFVVAPRDGHLTRKGLVVRQEPPPPEKIRLPWSGCYQAWIDSSPRVSSSTALRQEVFGSHFLLRVPTGGATGHADQRDLVPDPPPR